jgi:hypothetical protein
VQVGASLVDDPRRFAVFVPEVDLFDPLLEIDDQGAVGVRGPTTIAGDLTLDGGALEFGAGVALSSSPGPWRIYHHVEKTPVSGSTTQVVEHQLRIEMAGGSNGVNRVSIGAWSDEKNAFVPCLEVTDECQVIVSGNLVVHGQIDEQQNRAQAGLTRDAQQFLTGAALSGVGGSSILLDRFYLNQDPINQLNSLLKSEAGVKTIARTIAADDELFMSLVGELKRARATPRNGKINGPNDELAKGGK